MNKEAIKTFSYRISQANKTELVVITYDMAIEYIKDALKESDIDNYRQDLRMAKRVVDELASSLDYEHAISMELFNVYMVIERYIIKAGYGKSLDDYKSDENVKLLNSCIKMLSELRKSFYELSKLDNSDSMMKNTQQVYAGLTYSNGGSSNESYGNNVNRGYKV